MRGVLVCRVVLVLARRGCWCWRARLARRGVSSCFVIWGFLCRIFIMLNYNDITVKKYIELDGEPYEVVASQVSRKQANKPVNKTKIKSIISGRVVEKVFHVSDKAKEADMENREIKYLYSNRGEYWFCDKDNAGNRFNLPEDVVGNMSDFVIENSIVEALVFNDNVIGVKVPIKVELEVVEAPPAVKGNSATGATKQVVLKTGLTVNTPLFINEGDIVSVNTDTGEYTGRVEKK
ncbi:MAG TPA: elongation factor P [Candidatus Yonathbacteria bacterium]|nr:elongation factor P [Candidatus Yonathbacteria bacterium]